MSDRLFETSVEVTFVLDTDTQGHLGVTVTEGDTEASIALNRWEVAGLRDALDKWLATE